MCTWSPNKLSRSNTIFSLCLHLLQFFVPLRYNESITLVLFRIVHTVAFVTEVLYELDTVNVKIDYNMIKCAETYYIYVYIQETLICS